MTFASKLNSDTPQSLWAEQEALGARLMLTIPFKSSTKDMEGFVSVLGSDNTEPNNLPVLSICVAKPSGGAILSTIVFSSQSSYLDFIDAIHLDAYRFFSTSSSRLLS